MSRILMLTRCQYAEENIERIIRKLGHEIFCTTTILDMIKYGKSSSEFLKQFHIILLSETISSKECQEIIGKLEKDQFIIIQLRGEALAKEEQEGKRKDGIHYYLSTSASLETIRELLCKLPTSRRAVYSFDGKGYYSSEELLGVLTLTKMETRVFEELMASEGQTISRENLCRKIWKIEPNQSTQSQLSTLIKKIKAKMEESGINSNCIKTQWGLGYMLDTNVLRNHPTADHSILYQAQ